MDPVTQGVFGSLFAQAGARRRDMRPAAFAGFVAGLAPDLDVLIRSPSDSLLAIEYHRHFTHALSFAPVLATLTALVLWPVMRRWQPDAGFARLWLWTLLGVASHGLLDAMTSYGTRLFWPFSDWRVAWHAVSVIDPLFTLPVASLLGIGLWRRRPAFALAAAAWAAIYLSAGLIQQQRAEQQVRAWAAEAGIEARRVIAKPSFANLLVWRGLVDDGHDLHALALRLPPWGRPRIWPGASVERYSGSFVADRRLAQDFERFRHFSDDWLAHDARHDRDGRQFVGDFRYAIDPAGDRALWGILIQPDDPARPAEFIRTSRVTEQDREAFLARLAGQDPPEIRSSEDNIPQ